MDGLVPETFAVVDFRLDAGILIAVCPGCGCRQRLIPPDGGEAAGEGAVLTIWQGSTALRYVSGVVSGFGMKEHNGWQMQYHLQIRPPFWRSGLRQNYRIFQQQDIQGHLRHAVKRGRCDAVDAALL